MNKKEQQLSADAPLYWTDSATAKPGFPPVDTALSDPDGLLAIGGDLQVERLLDAYRNGIFPWFSAGQPILWWSPATRCVLLPQSLHVPRRLWRRLRRTDYQISFNQCFGAVIRGAAAPRRTTHSTWITAAMQHAYGILHERGHAHSVEVWMDGRLAGGLYGVALGRVFYAESMFSRCRDASKLALVHLVWALEEQDFPLIDCQLDSPHLRSLGATTISRKKFISLLALHTRAGQLRWPPAGWCPQSLRGTRTR